MQIAGIGRAGCESGEKRCPFDATQLSGLFVQETYWSSRPRQKHSGKLSKPGLKLEEAENVKEKKETEDNTRTEKQANARI